MEYQVLTREEMPIASEEDVVLVRRRVRSLAQQRGFDVFGAAAVTTAASELGRNVWVHARRGRAVLELVEAARRGLRLTFQDEGPGIPDVEHVLAGGNSTTNSLGLGLSGARRLVDEFTLESAPGHGTRVSVVKWVRR